MVPQLTFDEATHTYRVGGRVVQSVTQILGEVYRDVYAGIPPEILARKAALGTAVHRAIELGLRGTLDVPSLHPAVIPYFESWLQWWVESGFDVHRSEQKFYAEHGGYCGTIDFESMDAPHTVIDWKITSNKMPTHSIQIGGYAYAKKATRGGCLYLKDDGSPAEFVETDLPRATADWLATLRVFNLMKGFK